MLARRLYGFTKTRVSLQIQERHIFIVSIGNPEPEYAGSRHNAGHRVMNQLIDSYWKNDIRKRGAFHELGLDGQSSFLYKSNAAYMNLQGPAVQKAISKLPKQLPLVVLHDELQVELGKYQIRQPGTSHRGHNGLKSLNSCIPNTYTKVAIGIGRPGGQKSVTSHVLSRFNDKEAETIDFEVIPKIVDELAKMLQLTKT